MAENSQVINDRRFDAPVCRIPQHAGGALQHSRHDAQRGAVRKYQRLKRERESFTRAQRCPGTQKGPRGRRSPRGPCRPPRPLARIEKRPPRARRPALPQPGAAVLSAKAGLTAGFGMGPGDPRLCGRARGGRSPAAQVFEPARNPCPGRPWRPHGGHGRRSRIALGAYHRGCEELGLLVPLG